MLQITPQMRILVAVGQWTFARVSTRWPSCAAPSSMPIHFRAACSCSGAGGRIKRDSAYRLGFVVVEYRWHPLHGKKLRLYRRTVHAGASVIHVDTDEK